MGLKAISRLLIKKPDFQRAVSEWLPENMLILVNASKMACIHRSSDKDFPKENSFLNGVFSYTTHKQGKQLPGRLV